MHESFEKTGKVTYEREHPVCMAHEAIFDELKSTAYSLYVLVGRDEHQILKEDVLVCNLPAHDKRASVKKTLDHVFEKMDRLQTLIDEGDYLSPDEENWMENVLPLVIKTIATHFSMLQEFERNALTKNDVQHGDPAERVATYEGQLNEVERICIENRIPSPLRNIWNAEEMHRHLTLPEYAAAAGPGRVLLLQHLSNMFLHMPRHFSVAALHLRLQNKPNEVADLMDQFFGAQEADPITVLNAQPMLADTFMSTMCDTQDFARAVDTYEQLNENIRKRPRCQRKYLRGLLETGGLPRAQQFVEDMNICLDKNEPVDKGTVNAIVKVGWHIRDKAGNAAAVNFLLRHAPTVIGSPEMPGLMELCTRLLEKPQDSDDFRRFAALMGR